MDGRFMQKRIWEIDYFRGIAILLMVIFHLIVDLKDFHGFPVEYLSGFWYYEGKLSAVIFMFLAGLSSTLNRRPVKHGLKVLAAAGLVSVATYFFNPDTYVRFGILHLLGSAVLLSPFLSRLTAIGQAVTAVSLLLLPRWTDRLTENSGALLPIGITPSIYTSIDYYPLVPWLGVFILGLLAGRLYAARSSRLPLWRGTAGLCWLGRHSLAIYLAHQPILLALLFVLMPKQ